MAPWMRRLPTAFTLVRLAAAPLVATFVLAGHSPVALWLFVPAALSDALDGWLARRWNAETPLGARLDLVADKLLVGVSLIALCAVGALTPGLLAAATIILAREAAVTLLRQRHRLVPTPLAKAKTATQMLAVALLLAEAGWAAALVLWLAAGLSLVSLLSYVKPEAARR